MIELIVVLMLWIHNITGYSIPEPPVIKYMSSYDIKAYSFGCNLDIIPEENIEVCESSEFWDLDKIGPIALYDHELKTIILNNDFDINTVHDKSVLFHELVHHMQYENGKRSEVECIGILEKEAYELQDQWLQETYDVTLWDTIPINKMFFVLLTTCMTPGL